MIRFPESGSWRRIGCGILLALFLLLLARTAYNEWIFLGTELDVLTLFPDAVAQARARQGAALSDGLAAADSVIPPTATVLLVTAGREPRSVEYTAYHRALYALAPRAVWWANPAPPDGTWESRWWIETPLTAEALGELAARRGADFILFYQTRAPAGIQVTMLTPNAGLVNRGTAQGQSSNSLVTAPLPLAGLPGLVWSIAVCAVIGLGIVVLAARGGYSAGIAEAIAQAWTLGAGLVTVLMFWLDGAGLALDAQRWLVSLAGIVVAGICLVASFDCELQRSQVSAQDAPRNDGAIGNVRVRPVEIFLAGWIVIQFVYVSILAVGRPLIAWDSWVTFGMKARLILDANHIAPEVYTDASRTVTHLDYPLLVPLLEAWTLRWVGTADDRFAGIVSLLYFAALVCLLFAGLRRVGISRARALVVVALVVSLPAVNGAAAAVMADLPLALYALIAGLFVVVWLERRAWGALVAAAIAAGLMPWVKREGIVLLAALVVAIAVIGWRERKAWIAVVVLVASALVMAGPWWLTLAREGIVNSDFSPLTPATLQANWTRLPSILAVGGFQLLNLNWLLLWLILILWVLIRRDGSHRASPLPVAAFLYMGAMTLAFLFSAYSPYQQHVASSIDRLMVHVVTLVVVWGAYGWANLASAQIRN